MSELATVGAKLCSSVSTFYWSDEVKTIFVEENSMVIRSV